MTSNRPTTSLVTVRSGCAATILVDTGSLSYHITRNADIDTNCKEKAEETLVTMREWKEMVNESIQSFRRESCETKDIR